MANFKSTQRFSDRVADYVDFRPSYPESLIELLRKEARLGPDCVVADIASGTGILTKLLLATGADVYAVEPNQGMRTAAEKHLANTKGFRSIEATAENTGLRANTFDLITVAQAFHWLKPDECHLEFKRILKPNGHLAIIWNTARTDTPFAKRYEEIKSEFGGDDFRRIVEHSQDEAKHVAQTFGAGTYARHVVNNYQDLNQRALVGRFFSSSYAPQKNSNMSIAAEKALIEAFERFQKNGHVRMDYDTEVYLGTIA